MPFPFYSKLGAENPDVTNYTDKLFSSFRASAITENITGVLVKGVGGSAVGGTIGLILKEYDHSLLVIVSVVGCCIVIAFYIANTISAKCRQLREGELNYFVSKNPQFFTSAPYTNYPSAQSTFRNPMTWFQLPPPVIAPAAQPFNNHADPESGLLIPAAQSQQSSDSDATKVASISNALRAY